MACERCIDLCRLVVIRTPRQLVDALIVVSANVADGTIKLTHGEDVFAGGPWPDQIGNDYACSACGQTFALSVNTYHGRGGTWYAVGLVEPPNVI